MKIKLIEKNKLPLTFKYLEINKTKNIGKLSSNIAFHMECVRFQTDYYVRTKPYKNFTRLV